MVQTPHTHTQTHSPRTPIASGCRTLSRVPCSCTARPQLYPVMFSRCYSRQCLNKVGLNSGSAPRQGKMDRTGTLKRLLGFTFNRWMAGGRVAPPVVSLRMASGPDSHRPLVVSCSPIVPSSPPRCRQTPGCMKHASPAPGRSSSQGSPHLLVSRLVPSSLTPRLPIIPISAAHLRATSHFLPIPFRIRVVAQLV